MRLQKDLQGLEVFPVHGLEFDATTAFVLVDDAAIDGHRKQILIPGEQREHAIAIGFPAVHVFEKSALKADVVRLGIVRLPVIQADLPGQPERKTDVLSLFHV